MEELGGEKGKEKSKKTAHTGYFSATAATANLSKSSGNHHLEREQADETNQESFPNVLLLRNPFPITSSLNSLTRFCKNVCHTN